LQTNEIKKNFYTFTATQISQQNMFVLTQVSLATATAEDNEKELALTRVSSLEDFLLRHSENIDVNQYNDDGQTALQQSCLAGNLSLVKLLVRFGANMRLTTKEGFSILHIAAFSGHSDLLNFVMGQHQNGR
jgi:ankyrin repeat protein